MRTKTLVASLAFLTVIALSVTVSFSFGQANSNGGHIHTEVQDIQVEIQRLTQDWFTAFSKGDGAAMDQMEVPNLVLVNARGTGDIWQKKAPRAGKQSAITAIFTVGQSEVRLFRNTAILTGPVTRKDGDELEEMSETVVWIRMNNKWLVSSAQWTKAAAKKSN
jgi:hypothetical protein